MPNLEPWWYRWLSAGVSRHERVIHWYCQDPNSRAFIYRERTFSPELTATQFGAEIARATMGELQNQRQMTLWLDAELFQAAGGRSVAQQVLLGITDVLGPQGGFLWEFTEDERAMDDEQAWRQLQARKARLTGSLITVQASKADPVGIWEHTRNLLRWRPLADAPKLEMTRDMAKTILADDANGNDKYFAIMRQMEAVGREVLPKLQISAQCASVIRFLSSAVHDAKNHEVLVASSDVQAAMDSLRCGIDAHRGTQNRMPEEVFVAERLDKARAVAVQEFTGMSKDMVIRKAQADWKMQNSAVKTWSFRRGRG